jgi:Icc-related predicted phosphoesterase
VADPRGGDAAIAELIGAAEDLDVQAIVIAGDLRGPRDDAHAYRGLLRALGASGLPAFWVPGVSDAPVADYLHEAYAMEQVFPSLHGVHGTAAFGPGHVLFAGFGGEVDDDPDGARDELAKLSYPRWEPEYRLKLLGELKDHELVLVLATPPAHKGLATGGSEALAELVGTHRPRVVVCGGERGVHTLGRALVVAPGRFEDGHYAIADVHARTADLLELGRPAAPVAG